MEEIKLFEFRQYAGPLKPIGKKAKSLKELRDYFPAWYTNESREQGIMEV